MVCTRLGKTSAFFVDGNAVNTYTVKQCTATAHEVFSNHHCITATRLNTGRRWVYDVSTAQAETAQFYLLLHKHHYCASR